MIKRISTIKNLAVFKDFEWDKTVIDTNNNNRPIPFTKINILYGRNYSGKTTLSRILRALETVAISDKYDCPMFSISFDDGLNINQSQLSTHRKNIRVFNEDFVRENLRFINNPEDSIVPFAVLGEDNNALQKDITALESELGSNESGKETGFYAQLKSKENSYKEIDEAYKQAASGLDKQLADKATGRKLGIKYKVDKFGDPNYNISKLRTDIETVLSKTYVCFGNDKKNEFERLIMESVKPDIPSLPSISLQWEIICKDSEELLSRKIGATDKITELLLDATLNEWVKTGCELHKDKRTACAFCGGNVTDKRWDELFKHFDDESRLLEQKIDGLIENIQTEIKRVNEGFNTDKSLFYSNFQVQSEELSNTYPEVALHYIEQIKLIEDQLKKRKESITVSIPFNKPIDYSSEINSVLASYEELRKKSNDFSSRLSKEQIIAKNSLRLQEVYDFCTTINYKVFSKKLIDMESQKDRLRGIADVTKSRIKTIQEEIKSKKRQLNDEEKGAKQVNEYLTSFFGHEFLSLQAVQENDGQKKIRFEIVRNGKRAYHLSEGECSLIAFCYFMAKLNDIETKNIKPIIWIDDPISSLDGNHIFFVYSLIVAEIADKCSFEQLFISTHNLDFLKYLKRLKSSEIQADGKVKSCDKQYFTVNRNGDNSTIQLMPRYLKEFGTEFNYLFSCIYSCSCVTSIDDSNYHLFYNFGNNARKFLEIYLYFKYPDYSDDNVKYQRFFGEEKVPPILTARVNNEYSHGAIERACMPIEEPEMVLVAKLIIEKIKEDSDQYNALLTSIGLSV